jgi:SAM-dependent methyltransferase
MTDLFDAAAMYDEDYLYFFAAPRERDEPEADEPEAHEPGAHKPEAHKPGAHGPVLPAGSPGESDAELAWRLLDLRPGLSVLDLACGHGAMANHLAARGCRVTGLDSSTVFLDRARADASAAGLDVEYVVGDMRALPWKGRFDRLVNWSTAFGYFDDATNRAVLSGIAAALRPGGRLAMDLDNLTAFLAGYRPSRVVAEKEGGDMLVDRYHLDAVTGRFEARRTVIRDGRARTLTFVKRLFGFPELRDWLIAAGLRDVRGFGEDGEPLTADHRRMVVVATRPES